MYDPNVYHSGADDSLYDVLFPGWQLHDDVHGWVMDGLTPEQAQGVRNLVAGLKQCGESLTKIQAEMTNTLAVAAALLARLDMTAGPRE